MDVTLTPISETELTYDADGQQVGSLEWSWAMTASDGTRLARFGPGATAPLGVATASLRADHGYPPGAWEPEGAGYRYIVA